MAPSDGRSLQSTRESERYFQVVGQKITSEGIDPTHVFALSHIYESLLLKMGGERLGRGPILHSA